jgi:hypothetical protein
MKPGQISKPVYTPPFWSIIILSKMSKNNDLQPLDLIKEQFAKKNLTLFKQIQMSRLLKELRKKHQVEIRAEYFQPIISAYTTFNQKKFIDQEKFSESELEDDILKIGNKGFSLKRYIFAFNMAHQLSSLASLKEEDLSNFADNLATQYLLYLDAMEKDVDKNVLIKDKLVNKEYRLLLSKYLKEEIAQKVLISDADARKHYNNNRDKWTADYEKVEKSVKFDLKNSKLHERKNRITSKLRKKYSIRYNESLLNEIAQILTDEKRIKPNISSKP